ncbi:membrane protein LrgB-like family [Escherichia coli]|uniref:Membrane protein LrgB-like family n=1 Tax=Escherichia coli TaxID=562 RepID=A0A376SB10_ECOLX|nr:membrane protein LrgB-like family [Escherichia coli]
MMANIWWSLPLTLIVFFAARKLAARYKFPLLNPLLVAMVVIIPFLMLTGISYDSYFKGSEVLNDLLQPAVVALAYPLYEQLHQIRARWKSIITICFIGSVVAMVTGTSVALLMGASPGNRPRQSCRNQSPRLLQWRLAAVLAVFRQSAQFA